MGAVKKVTVIGGGSWGTTLADLLARKGEGVTLWVYEADLAGRMVQSLVNDLYLPGITLDGNLLITSDLPHAVADCDVLVLVPPSQVMRQVVTQALPHLRPDVLVISASKGIENDSLQLMSEVLTGLMQHQHPEQLVFLSGPSFAREVAAGMPTAVVAASLDAGAAAQAQALFSTEAFRVYSNHDIVGVELGGALKNVIALAAGVADGLGFGYNTRAALITRGLAEMTRLGLVLAAQAETFSGLAGMGDLVLTCTGDLSRNRSVGMELGKGRKLDDILSGMKMVAEGVRTTLSAYQLAKKLGVEMPITEQTYRILYEEKDPRQAVSELMLRGLRHERDSAALS